VSDYDRWAADYDFWARASGGFRHEPFTDESREFAWLARKPA
jgi:hypothetical protein